MINHITKICLALMLVLLLDSCGSKRTRATKVEIDGEQVSLAELYGQLADTYRDWQDFYGSVNLSLQAPASASISGRATMVRGDAILISLRMLGMEIGVLYIDSDSVFVLDKYHKYYMAESLDALLRGYPMTISDVQNFLLGQAFVPGSGTIAPSLPDNIDLAAADGNWTLQPARRRDGVDWWCTASETLPPILESITFVLNGANRVDCVYDDAVETDAGVAQSILQVYAQAAGKEYAARVKFDLDGAKWNTGRSISFSLPSGYRRIDVAALMEALKKI